MLMIMLMNTICMSHNNIHQPTLSRRTVLRKGAVISTVLGAGVTTATGHVAARTNAELIESMASEAGITSTEAGAVLDAFINATTEALKKGDRLSLTGFGSFSISKRSARTGRNPQTGKEIQIAAKNVVKFKAGAELSKVVN